jgi:hypothetical protein
MSRRQKAGRAAGQTSVIQIVAQILTRTLIEERDAMQRCIGLAGIIDNGPTLTDGKDMTGQSFWFEGGENIHRTAMAAQLPRGDTDVVIAMPSHDIRVIFPPTEEP